jgi:hypothetical protein
MLTLSLTVARAQEPDPNFHIYLCFGQSNMEGNAQWETCDESVDRRFRMIATTNFPSLSRTLFKEYIAKCPIVSPVGKLGMSDYFGRTMVAAMPDSIKIGVVAVAMGGSPIEMFDKDKCEKKLADNPSEWWATLTKQYYGGNAYQRLVDAGLKAQEKGIIKGILLHQGCSNNCDPNWPNMVKKIYNDLLKDLGLKAADVPLFVGETLRQDQGGACYGHNDIIANMPKTVRTSHVIHSNGCPGNNTDPWHFSAAGYRTMGKRYAYSALQVMGHETKMDSAYKMNSYLKKFFTVKSFDDHIDAGKRTSVTLQLWATFNDGHREDLTEEATFSSKTLRIRGGKVTTDANGYGGIVTATYTDFFGTEHKVDISVGLVDTPVSDLAATPDTDDAIYDLRGMRVATKATAHRLPAGIYVVNHRKVLLTPNRRK